MHSLTSSKKTSFNVLESLARQIRFITLEQLARGWWGGSKAEAKRALRSLLSKKLLRSETVLSQPITFDVKQPVSTWDPGDEPPDHDAVSYRLRSRWTEAPVRTVVYFITETTAHRLGGAVTRLANPGQVPHDLLLSEVFLTVRKHYPEVAQQWVGEDVYKAKRRGRKLPDAFIIDPDEPERVRLVIESGGEYDAVRVRAFHEGCEKEAFSYQLW